MIKLSGEKIYLATLERANCLKIYEDTEYDFTHPTEPFIIGRSVEGAYDWFDDIQKSSGSIHIRLGIFLPDGTVIGDIALQDLDWRNRTCTLGYGLTKLSYYSRGYVTDAVEVILRYAFDHLGLIRIGATTQENNIGSQKVLEKNGFILEGRERQVIDFAGKRHDRLLYGLLRDDYLKKNG